MKGKGRKGVPGAKGHLLIKSCAVAQVGDVSCLFRNFKYSKILIKNCLIQVICYLMIN